MTPALIPAEQYVYCVLIPKRAGSRQLAPFGSDRNDNSRFPGGRRHPLLGATGTGIGSCMMLFLLFLLLQDGRQLFGRTVRLMPMEPQRRGKPFVDETLARRP